MSEQAVEHRDATDEEDEQASEEPERQQASEDQGSSLATWTTVGGVVGAALGGAIGAVIGATLVRRPELFERAGEAINRDGGRVARAAATAAGGVFAAKSMQGLAQDTDNGERKKLMKQTAKEAGAAAAGATRDAIVAIRNEANDAA